MRKSYALIIFAATLFMNSCTTNKPNTDSTSTLEEHQIVVNGKVTELERGKDGYMATIETKKGEHYKATISIINFQKNNQEYKTLNIEDEVSVEGPTWSDVDGNKYIKVEKMK
ncbi:hypothetical protein [Empedobacter sp. GD03797]|uniref:hypothetical protein n=1 Tax=Empedobacter sp. GD03797 TaxID=2975382 RepID=UPI00244B7605|nr:hypothetical protein [Empedobacter sp. GD03797]MDH1881824.1 hypothetical protein [Empedobacter sp. GD03797]